MYARRYGTPSGNYIQDIFMFELSLGNISDHAYAGVLACVRGVQTHTETIMSL
jgi:hypothetical protein